MRFPSRWERALAIALISIPAMLSSTSFGEAPVLPISSVTPGAVNASVDQSNIQNTICKSGYTERIRPPASYTNSLKKTQLSTPPYSSYGSLDLKLFEEDHLISLELGGSPTSVKNLWPEPWDGPYGAHIKDKLENKLHALVCSGAITLAVAQDLIARNWFSAYQQYVLGLNPESTPTPAITPAPLPSATPVTSLPTPNSTPPPGATGLCHDGSYSFAANHHGMCSNHGGVAKFLP